MRLARPKPKEAATLALLLLTALACPASTSALPTGSAEFDAGTPRHVDSPAMSSIWDTPASPTPVVVVRPPEASPPAPERTQSPNPLWEIPLATLSTTRERPIFSPSRRPPPPAVAAAPVVKAPPPPPPPPRVERPQLSLVGTVGGAGEESFGIFVDQTTKAALRLRIGEAYQGWRLLQVQSREVMLEHDQQTAILTLPQPGASATVPVRAKAESLTAQRPVDSPPQQRDERR
jgi:hypothetical protein